jgi:hypothetical protein
MPPSVSPKGKRLDEAREAIDRVFGKGRPDVAPREVKDLLRELERLLGVSGHPELAQPYPIGCQRVVCAEPHGSTVVNRTGCHRWQRPRDRPYGWFRGAVWLSTTVIRSMLAA